MEKSRRINERIDWRRAAEFQKHSDIRNEKSILTDVTATGHSLFCLLSVCSGPKRNPPGTPSSRFERKKNGTALIFMRCRTVSKQIDPYKSLHRLFNQRHSTATSQRFSLSFSVLTAMALCLASPGDCFAAPSLNADNCGKRAAALFRRGPSPAERRKRTVRRNRVEESRSSAIRSAICRCYSPESLNTVLIAPIVKPGATHTHRGTLGATCWENGEERERESGDPAESSAYSRFDAGHTATQWATLSNQPGVKE